MSEFIFNRGIQISKEFIVTLNELRKDENSFWSKIVNDKELFIAIRDKSINVYYKGNSICKLSFDKDNNVIVGETHYKYLLRPDLKESYVPMINGEFKYKSVESKLIQSLSDIDSIKKASKPYSGKEKSGLHSILLTKNKNVIDTEITFGKDDNKTDRIDFVTLEQNNQQLNLVFYEAKHFTNKEIKSQGTIYPPVIEQIKRYEKDLEKHKDEILKSYKVVCEILKDLNIIKDRNLIESVNKNNLVIDFKPRLIIFGFDKDQRDGEVWIQHRQKLEKILGKERLKLIGKP